MQLTGEGINNAEVTLGNFSFPAGGHLAAQRAVFWPKLSNVPFWGKKYSFWS